MRHRAAEAILPGNHRESERGKPRTLYLFDVFDIGFQYGYEDYEMLGDRAVARGWFDQTLDPKAGGDGVHMKGKFIDVFKRAPDGSWKLAWCSFNTDHQ